MTQPGRRGPAGSLAPTLSALMLGGLWVEEEWAGVSGAPEGQGACCLSFSRCWYAPSGPAQGAASQYSGYQQGQGQQYGSYRASQTGPSAQQQRPYGYEQARPGASVET